MSDNASAVLELMVKLGVVGASDVQAANALLDETKSKTGDLAGATGGLNEEMGYVPENFKQVGEAAEDAGEKVNVSRERHMAMHHVMGELNRIFPGLGTSLHFISEGFMKAGESAEGAAAGTRTFGVALETVMAEILPLLAIVLTIQEATKLWEAHKQKVEEAAKAQEEAVKSMAESVDKLLGKMKELDDALHPTKNIAEKDEADLKHKIDLVKEQAESEKEINKANEDRELASATNEGQKQAIRDKYKQMDRNVEELSLSQTAGLQSAAAENAQKQIADIDARIAAAKARIDEENAKLKIQADTWKALDPQKSADAEQTIASNNNWLAGFISTTKGQAGSLGAFADNTQGESDDNTRRSADQRSTFGNVGRIERYTEAEQSLLKNKTFEDLLNATNKTHEQIENILQMIITRHVSLQYIIEQLQSQVGGQGQ